MPSFVFNARAAAIIGPFSAHVLLQLQVPNALVFIDKYNQVSRILGPIVHTIEALDGIWEDPLTRPYIEKQFGSVQAAKLEILAVNTPARSPWAACLLAPFPTRRF